MILRKLIKKTLGLCEESQVVSLREDNEHLTQANMALRDKMTAIEGQIKVDNVEMTYIKAKLSKIRQILGKDDNTFSKFTRKQIDDMSIGEFNSVEAEIDQDVLDGKLFLA